MAVPPHMRPPAGKTDLVRHPSSGLLVTTAGLPSGPLLRSSGEQVLASAAGAPRDPIPGYRGFMPAVKAETVWGGSFAKAKVLSNEMRPPPGSDPQPPPAETYEWRKPPDDPQGIRGQKDCAVWAYLQQEQPELPLWRGGEIRHFGPAIPGFCGNAVLRKSKRPGQEPAGHLEPGTRLELPTSMREDRDCQPYDVHRPAIPGYSGHIRHRHAG
jgi:hypothetical protein